jgi:hypothetical protein
MTDRFTSPLFDRPAIATDEDKLQMDVIAGILRGVVVPEVVRTRDYAHAASLARTGGLALHIVGWDKDPLETIQYIYEMRRSKEKRDRAAAAIVLCAAPSPNDYKIAQEAGATAVFATPLALGPLMKLMARVKDDRRPFVETPDDVGPCRRRAILDGGPRRRSDDPAPPPPAPYAATAIKEAVLLYNQVSTGALYAAAATCARLRKAGNVDVDAPMVEALDLIAPYLHGEGIPDPDSIARVGAAAVVRLAQMIGANKADRHALRDGIAKLAQKVAVA